MQAEMANFSQLVNQITDRFITSIQSIKASSLVRETRLLRCRGGEIRTPDLLLPKHEQVPLVRKPPIDKIGFYSYLWLLPGTILAQLKNPVVQQYKV